MKRVLCFVLTFVMMTSVLMTTVLAVDTEGDIVVPETLTEEAQSDLAGTIIYGSESIRRLPMTETSRNLDTKSWTTLYSDNNWFNEIATITNNFVPCNGRFPPPTAGQQIWLKNKNHSLKLP